MNYLIDAFKPYRIDGFIHDKPQQKCGNSWLYTAEYFIILKAGLKNGLVQKSEYDYECTTIKNAMLNHCIKTGLIKRTTDNGFTVESADDYIGAALLCKEIDISFAKQILEYGRKSKAFELQSNLSEDIGEVAAFTALKEKDGGVSYIYNNIEPEKFNTRAWLVRFRHMMISLQYAALESPSFLDKIYMMGYFLKKEEKESHDAIIKPWVISNIIGGKSFLIDFCIKSWRKRVKAIYNTPGNLLANYFQNENHPLVVWADRAEVGF
jgi:hypothetical protein